MNQAQTDFVRQFRKLNVGDMIPYWTSTGSLGNPVQVQGLTTSSVRTSKGAFRLSDGRRRGSTPTGNERVEPTRLRGASTPEVEIEKLEREVLGRTPEMRLADKLSKEIPEETRLKMAYLMGVASCHLVGWEENMERAVKHLRSGCNGSDS